MNDKINVSLEALGEFADLLIGYGIMRSHVEVENCGLYLKSIFLGEDPFVREDFEKFCKGQIILKQNNQIP